MPLAKKLIEKGYTVNGSTTSENKLSVLENVGINPFIVILSEVEGALESESVSKSINAFLAKGKPNHPQPNMLICVIFFEVQRFLKIQRFRDAKF